ncbi:MAG: oligopeptide/dipeptide ABC transporter ATP-binding protein [Candidatus Enteromonas sp.]|nr:oligopeptide/dipeptide ABC transporter ATP-binding protein [Candidatus Enteromonas sp.]
MAIDLSQKDRELIASDSRREQELALQVKNLTISFRTDNGKVQAVRGVSFDLYKGETLCIVGESGSGKSVTSKAIMGILSPNAIIEGGTILYNGIDLTKASETQFQRLRGKKIGMIFQDPLSSLNPIVRIGKQITETMLINKDMLKRYYDDLIAPALTAFMNAKSARDIAIFEAKAKSSLNRNDYQERLATLRDTIAIAKAELRAAKKAGKDTAEFVEKIRQAKRGIAELEAENAKHLAAQKAAAVVEISKAKAAFRGAAPGLKEALKAARADAKIKTKQHHEELRSVLEAKLKDINEKRAHLSLSKKDAQRVNELKKEIRLTKFSYRARILLCYLFPKIHARLEEELVAKLTPLQAELAEIRKEFIALEKAELEARYEYQSQVKITKSMAKEKALSVMTEVGIPQAERRYRQYPFQFSGGMRQRIVIAIALISEPNILICDEPTTALEVTIQAQILELINRLKKAHNMSVIFITHDLGVVANMADRVAVMYAGKICEYGTDKEIFFDPRHPYTWALLASIPDIDSKEKLEAIPGTPPDMIYPPQGDAFALRNRYAIGLDFKYEPPFFEVSPTHFVASWLEFEGAPEVVPPKIVSERIHHALEEEEAKISHENK